uniref:Uncharacterized protein n=1 Tax=Siphoviridae sp. ct0Go27 TaxID=2827761 RepID=A0A8S5RWD3_9CAUD|nr:MAG TPA: hypothetical protein [Siphoviridae sp. ct0Go27]
MRFRSSASSTDDIGFTSIPFLPGLHPLNLFIVLFFPFAL